MAETQTTEGVRERLIRAAESLFAERGLDAVSLREILAAAEVGNSSAVQYHFGDRSGLVRAVLANHHGATPTAATGTCR
jgi:AcrR family transcriptional regulator